MHDHNYYMNIAVNIANSALGNTSPNPPVGCVLVYNNKIISVTRTGLNGRPHAEEVAMHQISKNILLQSTMYVTLEPCYSRSTQCTPCVRKIINNKIPRIIIGTQDPNPYINGCSIKLLQQNNVEVILGILKNKCDKLISGFRYRLIKQRPFVTLKLAMSLDGKIALKDGYSKWITSLNLRRIGHKLRAKNDAIITGINTVIKDDPLYTVRLATVKRHPIRIILDTNLRIEKSMKILQDVRKIKTIVFHNCINRHKFKDVEYINIPTNELGLNLKLVVKKLAELGINNILIEAGQKISTSFIKEKLVDKIIIFSSNKIIGADGINGFNNLSIKTMSECPQIETKIIRDV